MGEIAALATAVCWALSSIYFTSTSKEIGALPVNRIRLVFAVLLLMVAHTALTGQVLPLGAEPERWLWLGLSGIVGLVLGDTFLFKAFALIGNRLGTLIMAGVPVLSGLLAWIFLGESLALKEVLGILVCVGGIALVVLERTAKAEGADPNPHAAAQARQRLLGIVYAVGGAAGQAGGLVLANIGLAGNYPSISGVMIRMLVAMIAIWALTLVSGQAKPTLQALFKRPSTTRSLLAGSLVGPFIGVWLSQIAVQNSYVGIASTLMAMTPIIMLPIAHYYYKERLSPRALLGTFIALAGVAVIFL
jgi:drug/metabolite transporter (DMT)-like permease